MSDVTLPARISLVGSSAFVTSVAVMHVVQPELPPVDVAVSYYLNGRWGWWLGAGLVALGIGSVSLAVALRRAVPSVGGPGFWLLVIWGMGAVLGGIFPPDPYGHWDRPPSIAGMVHGVSALLAFVAFPAAAWLLSRRLAVHPRISARAPLLEKLAGACAACLIVFFACLAPVFQDRAPYVLGLVERVLITAVVAWLVTAAVSVR